MTNPLIRKSVVCLLCLFLFTALPHANSQQQRSPNPILVFTGTEFTVVNGKNITRYIFEVFNKESYPEEMFAASPSLPPCGSNTSASRTWIDIYDQQGKRLNGFCGLLKRENLKGIWFGLDSDTVPPSWIYIEMTDRQTSTKYKSNLAETTL